MTGVFAVVALVGVATGLAALGFLHVVRTGLSVLRDPVSQYALTRYRWAYAVAAVAAGVAGLAVALLVGQVPETRAAVALLIVFAVSRVLIPLFPMDPPGSAQSRQGSVHSVLATLAFATVTASAFLVLQPFVAAGGQLLAVISDVAAVVMAVGSAVVMAGAARPGPRRVFGLAERLIYIGFIGWFAAVAVLLGLS